jgi:hypothetical protein
MDYINDKLQSLNYWELSCLLSSLKRDKQAFITSEIETPKQIQGLINKTWQEIEKRAELIPSEMLKNDLKFNYTLME